MSRVRAFENTDLELQNPAVATLYNLPRLRGDVWNRLRDSARTLRRRAEEELELEALQKSCALAFGFLDRLERYCSFPGRNALDLVRDHFEKRKYEAFARQTIRLVRLLTTQGYRRIDLTRTQVSDYADLLNVSGVVETVHASIRDEHRPYFEVLVVDELTPAEELAQRSELRALRSPEDPFLYEMVAVPSFEDALLAILVNANIEACVIRNTFSYATRNRLETLGAIYELLDVPADRFRKAAPNARTILLGEALRRLRPELDLYLVSDAPVEDVAGEATREFRRIFYHQEDFRDLHLSILKGIHDRFEAPFFQALCQYSRKPTGMFHALPVSRGRTIATSHWIRDLGEFYGHNLFLAETSATTGGLDSLLQPTGSLKRAQELASRAFGARNTYFVTNGTSTANKIVMQALVRPGDIVLLAHDCHKSHHYAVILAGAHPVYLDGYALSEYSMYGGVTVAEIKRQLLELRRAGKLDRVRMLLLTNITFDGITYDPLLVMEEVLAIKPDMIFVWDEAWFAYGRFSPFLRRRTAMEATRRLRENLAAEERQRAFRRQKKQLEGAGDDAWLARRLVPDPDRTRVRVYATQSTHKTLTSLRQGSMIHVHDHQFELEAEEAFHEAYMTHTSTSPNYQILATLDVGRRQVELEGYELVQRSLELAMTLRERVTADQKLRKYFDVLGTAEMVPVEHRPSGLEFYYDPSRGFSHIEKAWKNDEFVLDPTRVTFFIGRTGHDGDTFKKLLMDRFDIHVNKTSRNTVLFMIHIGMTRGTIAHLVKVLTIIAEELDDRVEHLSHAQRRTHEARVASLSRDVLPLPNFSRFHPAFVPHEGEPKERCTPEADVRAAFFLAYDDRACDFVPLDTRLLHEIETGRTVVSAGFVTPYPPGFPVLVPGQVVTPEILRHLLALDVKEIHGYDPGQGLRVFREEALEGHTAGRPYPNEGGSHDQREQERRSEGRKNRSRSDRRRGSGAKSA